MIIGVEVCAGRSSDEEGPFLSCPSRPLGLFKLQGVFATHVGDTGSRNNGALVVLESHTKSISSFHFHGSICDSNLDKSTKCEHSHMQIGPSAVGPIGRGRRLEADSTVQLNVDVFDLGNSIAVGKNTILFGDNRIISFSKIT